jgi:DNA-binding response OmpR family regulator
MILVTFIQQVVFAGYAQGDFVFTMQDFTPIQQEDDADVKEKADSSQVSSQSYSEPPLPKYNYGMERVLVVEDDRAVQRALKRLFESKGYGVDIAGSGTAALELFQNAPPSVVLLDLRLPGASGKEVCREIKSKNPSLPVIVLSATTDVVDKVLLLELGADDYVTKPFSPRELLARVQGALRRSARSGTVSDLFVFGNISVDFTKMELKRAGQPISLTAQEFKVLKFFSQNLERVVTREELLNEVWGYQNYPSTRTVDNHILKLRQKIEKDPAFPVHFRTVHGTGYKFVR